MKFVKKLTRLMILLLLRCMLFTGCKDKKEAEIPTDFNHIENTEEIEMKFQWLERLDLTSGF
ncbi:hypothetical protein KQI61_01480 [Anaerocolumna aminovalerica]|uniref:hypothetical protein n=1 Tax=Anaerocolumna aminovalerica TaxID=1527 RepID=UPI001C0F3A98|nr:hypothetical protein [Anaerocolumna aminovalerica]MBU5330857.1 hypothetical protein [Anaerocolumna aminovalerica]